MIVCFTEMHFLEIQSCLLPKGKTEVTILTLMTYLPMISIQLTGVQVREVNQPEEHDLFTGLFIVHTKN